MSQSELIKVNLKYARKLPGYRCVGIYRWYYVISGFAKDTKSVSKKMIFYVYAPTRGTGSIVEVCLYDVVDGPEWGLKSVAPIDEKVVRGIVDCRNTYFADGFKVYVQDGRSFIDCGENSNMVLISDLCTSYPQAIVTWSGMVDNFNSFTDVVFSVNVLNTVHATKMEIDKLKCDRDTYVERSKKCEEKICSLNESMDKILQKCADSLNELGESFGIEL